MKRFCIFALQMLLLSDMPAAVSPVSDAEVEARRSALELAAAFSNEGYKLRDGQWIEPIKSNDQKVVQVNLYAGNQYWFSAGATAHAKKLEVSIFDETGKPVQTEEYQGQGRAAAGFTAEISGPYFVRVTQVEGEPAIFSLVYSYK
jgi:hypothetical protein